MIAADGDQLLADTTVHVGLSRTCSSVIEHLLHLVATGCRTAGVTALVGVDERVNAALYGGVLGH